MYLVWVGFSKHFYTISWFYLPPACGFRESHGQGRDLRAAHGPQESGTAGEGKAVDNYVENIEGEWRRATPDRW